MGQKMRRIKSVKEARWRDFSIYLSRHAEECVLTTDKLQEVYSKWRVPLGYAAPFAAMLRALQRHDILYLTGHANDTLVYTSFLGIERVDSSDDEEDLEEVIAVRDSNIINLQLHLHATLIELESEMRTHATKLEERMQEVQHRSDRIFESAQGHFVAKVAELQADKEILQAHVEAKEGDVRKVQYLLRDGDSVAAVAAKLKEEGEAASVRWERREQQLLDTIAQHQAATQVLKKQLDVADVILKSGREQLKLKVGFATQVLYLCIYVSNFSSVSICQTLVLYLYVNSCCICVCVI